MAALGWLLNLGFAGGGFPVDSRDTVIAGGNRIFIPATPDRSGEIAGATRSQKPASRTDCVIPGSNRTFTPADE